ncbi:MAG: hypothetical protein LC114_15540, partial [Bryobacterales bacterium]|nr:hypothetical protein [Bryobacterales bacterium]
ATARKLVPSGRLEFQVLRLGVAFAAFPVEDVPDPTTFEEASQVIRAMAKRDAEFVRRMSARAVARPARRAHAEQPLTRHQDVMRAEASLPVRDLRHSGSDWEILASLALLSTLGSERLARLLEAMAVLAGNSAGSANAGRTEAVSGPVSDTRASEPQSPERDQSLVQEPKKRESVVTDFRRPGVAGSPSHRREHRAA